jgi:hypothetical protein
MKLRELMKDIKESCTELELEDYLDVDLSFKLMVKNGDFADDDTYDIDLSSPEIICSSGSFFVELGMFVENNIPIKEEYKYYFEDINPNNEEA